MNPIEQLFQRRGEGRIIGDMFWQVAVKPFAEIERTLTTRRGDCGHGGQQHERRHDPAPSVHSAICPKLPLKSATVLTQPKNFSTL